MSHKIIFYFKIKIIIPILIEFIRSINYFKVYHKPHRLFTYTKADQNAIIGK